MPFLFYSYLFLCIHNKITHYCKYYSFNDLFHSVIMNTILFSHVNYSSILNGFVVFSLDYIKSKRCLFCSHSSVFMRDSPDVDVCRGLSMCKFKWRHNSRLTDLVRVFLLHSSRRRFVRHAVIEGEWVTAENQSVTGHLWVMCPRCSADLLVFLKRLTRASA